MAFVKYRQSEDVLSTIISFFAFWATIFGIQVSYISFSKIEGPMSYSIVSKSKHNELTFNNVIHNDYERFDFRLNKKRF